MQPAARAFLERARVGALATVDDEGRPHVVPICYAILEDAPPRLVSPIDDKPKSTRDLRRVRNVRSNPHATVLVDHYSEDWARLGWVQVRGRARVVQPGANDHGDAVRTLESKYEQYAEHPLHDRPIIELRIETSRSWGALETTP